MNRRTLRASAVIGAAALSALAVAPVFAASEPVSQASAQALQLSIAGTPAVTQLVTSTNDGTAEDRNDASTLPPLVSVIPGNNLLSAGVGVQQAKANADSTSYACAGIAGTGGGLVTVGTSSCNIDGKPLTLDLGSLNLDLTDLIGGDGAITSALNGALGSVIGQIGSALDDVLSQLTGALKTTPLGEIGLTGGLSAVEATCTADPSGAQGDAQIVDTSGHHTIPITLNLPGTAPLDLVDLDVDVPAKPGGTDVFVNLDTVTQGIIDAVTTEVQNAVGGGISALNQVLQPILQTVQDQIVTAVVNALKPALQAISDNILKITVNDVTPGDGGKSVTATALSLEVLGAAKQFTGNALISGTIGQVHCGPNRAVAGPPTTTPTPTEEPPGTPTVVDSGLSGASHTTRDVLMATTALMLLAGTAGLVGYRRMLTK